MAALVRAYDSGELEECLAMLARPRLLISPSRFERAANIPRPPNAAMVVDRSVRIASEAPPGVRVSSPLP